MCKSRISVLDPCYRKLHIGLTCAEPHDTYHYVLDSDLFVPVIRDYEFVRSAALLGREIDIKSSVLISPACRHEIIKPDFNPCAGLIPSPYVYSFSSLNDHSVGNDLWKYQFSHNQTPCFPIELLWIIIQKHGVMLLYIFRHVFFIF